VSKEGNELADLTIYLAVAVSDILVTKTITKMIASI